MWGLS